MIKSTHLGDLMETCCKRCHSRFHINQAQLSQAYGKVTCGECGCVFNALNSLKSYEGKLSPGDREKLLQQQAEAEPVGRAGVFATGADLEQRRDLSLHEAMYGSERRSFSPVAPLVWFIGILLLIALSIAQTIYYQRYQLIEVPRYQQQVINLCQVLPCSENEFASTDQIKLLDRNVFTHPVSKNALMVTGAFVNQAPFTQKLPDLLIGLFDIQGNLIANRLFAPAEYSQDDKNNGLLQPGKPVQFRLEIVDPGTDALTYEFEFY